MKSFLKQINESFESLEEKQERWQDNDGDGKWYEPGIDVKEEAKPDYLDFDGDNNKEEPMVDALEDIECDKCKGAGCDHCDGTGYHKKVDETSVAANAGSYMTPKAFGPASKKTIESLGYKRVQEAMDRKYEQLIEGYRNFVLSDSKMSPARKVNASIREVAKQLKTIEETINYTSRLKTESGLSHSGFSSGTHNALKKISERLIKISERVRSLGE